MSYFFNQEENDPQNYYWFEKGLNQEELDKLYTMLEQLPYQDATVIGNQDEIRSDVRSSRIKWIPQSSNWQWLYEKFMDLINEANDTLWKFNLVSVDESIQYTEYLDSNEGHYDWHQDIGMGSASLRKVSLTLQLSDSEEYEGGDLEVYSGQKEPSVAPRGAGVVVIFPSYMMHRVTKVTKGTRKSLVLWVGGEHYK